MAAKSPISSTSSERLVLPAATKAQLAGMKAGTAKPEALAAMTDQEWLEQSQQAWAERRAQEEALAKAEKSGDRVIQLLDGEQVGEAVGESLVVAQASTKEDDRKAAADRGIAAVAREEEDESAWWPWIRAGVGAALLSRIPRGSDAAPVDPTDPTVPPQDAVGLRVYSTEENDGSRSETSVVASQDTNTDEGPYNLVSVRAVDNGDTARLNNGSGGAVNVSFIAGDTHTLEVLAMSEDASASAEITTTSEFNGSMLVSASGDHAESTLEFYAQGPAHSIDLTVQAAGVGACADAYLSLEGAGEDLLVSLDATVSADGINAAVTYRLDVSGRDSSADMYVQIDAVNEVIAQLDVLSEASGRDATSIVDVNLDANGVFLSGEHVLTMSADFGEDSNSFHIGEDESAAQFSSIASGAGSFSDLDLAVNADSVHAALDFSVDASDAGATASLDVSITLDSTGASGDYGYPVFGGLGGGEDNGAVAQARVDGGEDYSLNIQSQPINGGEDTTINFASTTDAANWVVTASGENADAALNFAVEGVDTGITGDWNVFNVSVNADLSVQSSGQSDASAYLDLSNSSGTTFQNVSIGGAQSYVGNQTGEYYSRDENYDTTTSTSASGSVDVTWAAADWTVEAVSGGNADLSLDIDAYDSVGMQANVAAIAGADANASVDINIDASWVTVGGTLTVHSEFVDASYDSGTTSGYTQGEDTTTTLEAAVWTAEAKGEGGSAAFDATLNASYDLNMAVEAVATASGTDSFSSVVLNLSANYSMDINGGLTNVQSWVSSDASDDVARSADTIASTEYAADWAVTASGQDSSADLDVNAFADSIELEVNQAVMASGAGSYAAAHLDFSADYVQLSGERRFPETDISVDPSSIEVDNAYWTVEATGSESYAELSLDITATDITSSTWDASGSMDLDLDLLLAATGTDSSVFASLDLHASYDIVVGDANGSQFDLTAGGEGSSAELDIHAVAGDYMSMYLGLDVAATGADSAADANLILFAGEDMYIGGDGHSFAVTADGEGASASLYMEATADVVSNVDLRLYLDSMAVSATGTDSFASADFHLYAGEDLRIDGDEVAATWSATAEGDGSTALLHLEAYAGGSDHFHSALDVAASGVDSVASAELDFSADNWLHIGYDDGEVFSVTASGAGSLAQVNVSGYGEDVDFEYDTVVSASGAHSVALTTVDLYGSNDLTATDYGDGSDLSVSATGDESLADVIVNLQAADYVDYMGHVSVLASTGADAYAGLEINLSSDSGSVDFSGVVDVTALGADNEAMLSINLSSSYSAEMYGELNVTASDDSIASVSIISDGDFYSAVSLTANDGGHAILSLVAESSDSIITVDTDRDSQVTLEMDVNEYTGRIDVYGNEGGVFDLVLQDGFSLDVDLDPNMKFGGQFNLTVESPMNVSLDAGQDYGYWMRINGFDTSGTASDTLNFKGDEFDGSYIDATVSSSDGYDDVFASSADFFTAADTALDGSVDYFFGTDGTNGWLAVDGDGDGIDYFVELVGVTTMDWNALNPEVVV